MAPVWMIEGGAAAPEPETTDLQLAELSGDDSENSLAGRDVAEKRFAALAQAVREHQSRKRHTAVPARPEDMALYRRLRQICGA